MFSLSCFFGRAVARQQQEDELSLWALTDHRLCTYTSIASPSTLPPTLPSPSHSDLASVFVELMLQKISTLSLEGYHRRSVDRRTAAPSAAAGAAGVSAGRLEENLLLSLLLHRCYAAPVLLLPAA